MMKRVLTKEDNDLWTIEELIDEGISINHNNKRRWEYRIIRINTNGRNDAANDKILRALLFHWDVYNHKTSIDTGIDNLYIYAGTKTNHTVFLLRHKFEDHCRCLVWLNENVNVSYNDSSRERKNNTYKKKNKVGVGTLISSSFTINIKNDDNYSTLWLYALFIKHFVSDYKFNWDLPVFSLSDV